MLQVSTISGDEGVESASERRLEWHIILMQQISIRKAPRSVSIPALDIDETCQRELKIGEGSEKKRSL